MKRFASLLLVLAVSISAAAAQTTILMVRHAEKAKSDGNDPDLSEAGRARAIERFDWNLSVKKFEAVYTSALKRR